MNAAQEEMEYREIQLDIRIRRKKDLIFYFFLKKVNVLLLN